MLEFDRRNFGPLKPADVVVPMSVPASARDTYVGNFLEATCATGRLSMFAMDQYFEHLFVDFYQQGHEDTSIKHLFDIAVRSHVGAIAVQLGPLTRMAGMDSAYGRVPTIVKVTSKTDYRSGEPYSAVLDPVDAVLEARERGLNIVGVGTTVYPGSEYEERMYAETRQIIREAHQAGLLAVVWCYPRGAAVVEKARKWLEEEGVQVPEKFGFRDAERHPKTVLAAAAVLTVLSPDFGKINPPDPKKLGLADPADETANEVALGEAVKMAWPVRVMCAGGSKQAPEAFLAQLKRQIDIAGVKGNATGRNIHERPLEEAVRMADAIASITVAGATVEEAMAILRGELPFPDKPLRQ
ncbi:MAG: aldolase [Armatimonadetes bacterium]|nr:aldolase [Armatimonadota bacterium]